MNLGQQYEKILPTTKITEDATGPLPGLAP